MFSGKAARQSARLLIIFNRIKGSLSLPVLQKHVTNRNIPLNNCDNVTLFGARGQQTVKDFPRKTVAVATPHARSLLLLTPCLRALLSLFLCRCFKAGKNKRDAIIFKRIVKFRKLRFYVHFVVFFRPIFLVLFSSTSSATSLRFVVFGKRMYFRPRIILY